MTAVKQGSKILFDQPKSPFMFQITDCTTDCSLRDVVTQYFDILVYCGMVKPSTSLSLADRPDIVQAVALHHVLLRPKAELDHGLRACRILVYIRANSALVKNYFTIAGHPKLTSGM